MVSVKEAPARCAAALALVLMLASSSTAGQDSSAVVAALRKAAPREFGVFAMAAEQTLNTEQYLRAEVPHLAERWHVDSMVLALAEERLEQKAGRLFGLWKALVPMEWKRERDLRERLLNHAHAEFTAYRRAKEAMTEVETALTDAAPAVWKAFVAAREAVQTAWSMLKTEAPEEAEAYRQEAARARVAIWRLIVPAAAETR